ncbi:BgTH12-05380 [Blumeria graminis f. sp. triticale]|uniref:BgTH12-05380 n=2 Tax=Blumeria graminis TaxID=34373 RepID=A0A9W4GGE5_BLUGR|nr:BgTH12-05380 [Blumeria graminis f. sp. triticale]
MSSHNKMSLSEELYVCINQRPLTRLRARFRQNYDNAANPMGAIHKLLNKLVGYTIGFDDNAHIHLLQGQIYDICGKITRNKVFLPDFKNFVDLIASDASDRECWSELIALVDDLTYEEPQSFTDMMIPIIEENTTTTYTRSTSEIPNYDATCLSLTVALKIELTNNIYKSVGNFWEVYFENERWSQTTTRIWECYQDNNQCQPYVFHQNMNETELRAWFYTFFDRYLKQFTLPHELNTSESTFIRTPNDPTARGKFCHTTHFNQLEGAKSRQKLDFFIEVADLAGGSKHHWRDIRVIGEFTKSAGLKGVKFHQLTRYIREIFYAQPLRRFVHGFVVHKLHAEFWVVDRSGAYSSGEISLIESEEKLVRAISSYMFMSDEELGLDTTIFRKDGLSFVTIREGDEPADNEIEIMPEPIYRPETIVSRANLCHRTKDDLFMVKFSWGSGAERSEIDYLKLAKPVNGVVNLVWDKVLHEVEAHRAGLDFSMAFKVSIKNNKWCLSRGLQNESQTTPGYFRKRKLTLAILSPNGRPLKSSRSLREFLSCILDAIIGHRDLYNDAKVLHGDVSEGNIILTKPDENGKSEDTLIDLDMSTSVDGKVDEKEEMKIIGTVKYMAIELLKNMSEDKYSIKKSCRYDLESFFYVFLVGCLRYGRPSSEPANLNGWYTDDLLTNYNTKRIDITVGFEKNIIDHFSPSFDAVKELARDFRKILFGSNLDQFISKPNSVELYDPIIHAFKNVITQIDEGHIKNENLDLPAVKKRMRRTNSRGGSMVKPSRTKSRGVSALISKTKSRRGTRLQPRNTQS